MKRTKDVVNQTTKFLGSRWKDRVSGRLAEEENWKVLEKLCSQRTWPSGTWWVDRLKVANRTHTTSVAFYKPYSLQRVPSK